MNRAQTRVEVTAKRLPTYVRWIDTQGREVIALRGSVDLEPSSRIRKALLETVSNKRDVLVDLSQVNYLDSSGIACLVEALQLAREHGAELGLVSVSTQAMRVLQLANLDKVFPISNRRQAEQVL